MTDKQNQIFLEMLRKEGLRFTQQRQAVWDELKKSHEHRDAEEIYISIRNSGSKVSRATVYRTIHVLVNNRLLRKMDMGDGRNRFEPRLDDKHHDHIICLETGDIIEFYSDELEKLQETIAKDHGYELVRHVHQLFVKPLKK
tara:strand:- start:385 stop:810 length:426 start_codon:yes stop_codon:yes gene_type:complete